MIAIDTNILIYGHRAKTTEHQRALNAISQASADPRGWGTSLPCITEFLCISTHPKSVGRRSTVAEASGFLSQLEKQASLQIWLPHEGFATRLAQMAVDLGVAGVQLFDLQVAVVAFENGATELWTHDRGFIRLPGLKIIDPLLWFDLNSPPGLSK